ncbi:MAG: class I SAM-dependent methyltransferase [Spirochaetes bacterium]|nr:class I SAM-dependent methyltransferase [Spirochaetota bacterium]
MTENTTEEGIPAGNLCDKYTTRNPIYRMIMSGYFRDVRELVDGVKDDISTASEIGCGEGYLASYLSSLGIPSVRGCDFSERIIRVARERNSGKGISYHVKSIYDIGRAEAADLVVCCEVLEHLNDPDSALDSLHGVTGKYCLMSVPREPLWRALNLARGRYLSSLGNTPGHIRHWSSRSFLRFVSRRFKVLEVRRPIPWTMVLCEKKG